MCMSEADVVCFRNTRNFIAVLALGLLWVPVVLTFSLGPYVLSVTPDHFTTADEKAKVCLDAVV